MVRGGAREGGKKYVTESLDLGKITKAWSMRSKVGEDLMLDEV